MFKLHAVLSLEQFIQLCVYCEYISTFFLFDLFILLFFYHCAVAMLEIDVKEMQMYIGC